jgi:hypothetical protein
MRVMFRISANKTRVLLGYYAAPVEDQVNLKDPWDFTCEIDGYEYGLGVCCRDVCPPSFPPYAPSFVVVGACF